MVDTPKSRGVVDSIRALRERRYMEYGPGAKQHRKLPAPPTVDKLRADVAKIPAKKAKKSKKRSRR